ncbi:hypothetical protein [Deinococcus altitudinis]|uniref:hypothetical protein n=1 Tax=Deinococcus altitudinis TaxID=468914 RepID=UPI003892A75B
MHRTTHRAPSALFSSRVLGVAGLGLVLALALNACGSAKDVPDPGGTPTADRLSGSTMSGAVLETFAQTATPQVQIALARYASGKGFDQVGGPPLLGFLGGGVAGLSVAQTRAVQAQAENARQIGTQGITVVGTDCTTVPGDQTDADTDGILDASTATYACAGDLSFAYGYDGQWAMKDKVQQDGGAAYLFTGNSLGHYSVRQGLLTYAWTYAEKSSLDTLARAGGGSSVQNSTAQYVYNWDARGSAGVLGVAASFDLKWRLNLSLDRTPDAGGPDSGSTVKFSGQASAGNTQTGLGGFSDLTGTLHYSSRCGGFDGGSLKYTSGGSSKTLSYTGCNTSQ